MKNIFLIRKLKKCQHREAKHYGMKLEQRKRALIYGCQRKQNYQVAGRSLIKEKVLARLPESKIKKITKKITKNAPCKNKKPLPAQ